MPRQNKDRSAIRADFLETANMFDIFSYSIIAGDETCCPQYDPQTKVQSAEWRRKNSPASRKYRAQPSKTKQNKKTIHCLFSTADLLCTRNFFHRVGL
jgi:hypothetical protein